MKTLKNIKFYDELIIIVTDELLTRSHCVYALKLVVGIENEFEIVREEGSAKFRSALIRPNTVHQLYTGKGLTVSVLINPQSILADALAKAFSTSPIVEFGDKTTSELISYFSRYLERHYQDEEIKKSLAKIIAGLEGFEPQLQTRIKTILSVIGDDKGSSSFNFKGIVVKSGLSESRLMHYFKDETGMTIRKYILWTRLQRALKLIAQGYKIKDASSDSGFTDSAHFSRTFVSMFGVKPSSLVKRRVPVQ